MTSSGRKVFIRSFAAMEQAEDFIHWAALGGAGKTMDERAHFSRAAGFDLDRDTPAFQSDRNAERDALRELQLAHAALDLVLDAREARKANAPELVLQTFELIVPPEPWIVDHRR